MGGGLSMQASAQEMILTALLLSQAVERDFNPLMIQLPDMYTLHDFNLLRKRQQVIPVPGGIVVTETPPQDLPPEEELLRLHADGEEIVLRTKDLGTANDDGWTALHACCHSTLTIEAGQRIVEAMVEMKMDIDAKTIKGPGYWGGSWTALHIAAAYGIEELVEKLLQAGANPNVKNRNGWTPLHDATHRGALKIVELLVKAGADMQRVCPPFDVCPLPGQTALGEASRWGHSDVAKLLLENGADKDAQNEEGWTPLHEACSKGHATVVQTLLDFGADPMKKDVDGYTPIAFTSHTVVIALLVERLPEEEKAKQGVALKSQNRRTMSDWIPPADFSKEEEGGPQDRVELIEEAKEGNEEYEKEEKKETDEERKKEEPAVQSEVTKEEPVDSSNKMLATKEKFSRLGDLPSLDRPKQTAKDIPDTSYLDATSSSRAKTREHQQKSNVKSRKGKSKVDEDSLDTDGVPTRFKCSLTKKVMKNPVRSPYGHVFEKTAVEQWFRKYGLRCPLTGQPLAIVQLVPDDALRSDISRWEEEHNNVEKDTIAQGKGIGGTDYTDPPSHTATRDPEIVED